MWVELTKTEASSDESGKGDFFGGIHVCACYIDKEAYEKLKSSGILDSIRDSKKITNQNIKKIASDLLCLLEGNISVVNLDVQKFNELYKKFKNLNVLTAYVHNLTWQELSKKVNISKVFTVIDDFCTKSKYYDYLFDIKVADVIKIENFINKAESQYLSCAIASIIARFYFIQEIETLSKFCGLTIPFGCSYKTGQSVIDAFHELQEKIGPTAIEHCKQCFKTVEKLELI